MLAIGTNVMFYLICQYNLISQSLWEKLKIGLQNVNIPLSGISQVLTKIKNCTQTKIKPRFNDLEANLQFLVLPTLTETLPIG